ncbi:A/G-specific adenine glycosylase [Riemerella anatipestifer]|uniref:Adenine DNA glycosylase n=1 Tax=Riemerella anatipestifer TaxID=34085 RepID=A0AAP3EVY8_RIEAN|nr:A/G-specific adenine glycosylase [Riemerella anatipestifer]AZZ59368.1 A/G-specific adenine glycosylase [Riemerella anatipestifer]MBT0572724.1 A/G-specific adenine glycosylase [Riemerella anatipestifer]MCU7568977.1 A/G-specific adenine glycosylase [Riemerella anatipestifer]MCW0490913.1 A/G-specific adenine glycosylase [Riemerella anatipestifer]MCW0509876.1 A/G-specific adenine glycosylase [Riemerella anatipestifer]
MKINKQNPDFLNIGFRILQWYKQNARDLPWRATTNPYNIWICEIILQQTQVQQGLQHYLNFVARFPDVKSLAEADTDEVLLYWKGLGYYSRAINLQYAARQIMQDFGGTFPTNHKDILKLKGIGKYTAAAICSISYQLPYPAIDGNFYRVFSRFFADDFDISKSNAFDYFSELTKDLVPKDNPGDFNQAIMDLGSGICKPKQPSCELCPLSKDCVAFNTGTIDKFPVKIKKVKTEDIKLKYYFIHHNDSFVVKKRDRSSIWKNLYDFPEFLPEHLEEYISNHSTIKHKLTHKNLEIEFVTVTLPSAKLLEQFAHDHNFNFIDYESSQQKSFPKPLENYIDKTFNK